MGFLQQAAFKLADKLGLVKVVCCGFIALFKQSDINTSWSLVYSKDKKLQLCLTLEAQVLPTKPKNISIRPQEISYQNIYQISYPRIILGSPFWWFN